MASEFLLTVSNGNLQLTEINKGVNDRTATPTGNTILPRAFFNYIARKIDPNAMSLTFEQRGALVIQDIANEYNKTVSWSLLSGRSGNITPSGKK